MVYRTHIKTKLGFKLDDDELDSANLNKIKFLYSGTYITKYIITELEDLIADLAEKIDPDDSRKQYFEKYKKMKTDRDNVINLTIELSAKSEHPTIMPDIIKKLRRDIDKEINLSTSTGILDISLIILDKAEQIAKVNHFKLCRKLKIDALVKNCKFDREYVDLIESSIAYNKYVDSGFGYAEKIIQMQKEKIQLMINVENRKKILGKNIKKDINPKYHEMAFNHEQARNYISHDLNIDEVMVKIKIDVSEVQKKAERKNLIDDKISKSVSFKYINKVHSLKQYQSFLQNGGDIDETIKHIRGVVCLWENREEIKKKNFTVMLDLF
jgi:hypothetical protein